MALFDNAKAYADITKLLDAGLDDSFTRDPVFAPAPHVMLFDRTRRRCGKGASRTPAFPRFPLAQPTEPPRIRRRA